MKIKKILISLLALTTIGVGAMGMSACDMGNTHGAVNSTASSTGDEIASEQESASESEKESDADCSHTYVIDNAIEATCENAGLTAGTHCGVCGEVFLAQEVVDALGHDFTNYVFNNDATCQANGTETAVCARKDCNAKDTREKANSMLAHATAEEWSYDLTHHWKNYTCQCEGKAGYAEHSLGNDGRCSVCAKAITFSEGVVYDISADGTYMEVIDYTGNGGDIVIADTYNGLPVKNIYQKAFDNKDNITSVYIPEGVTSIGDYAFSSCSSLTSIEIPDSVTSIGDGAFYWCSSLTSVVIPDSVTSIGNSAFSSCSKLQYNEYGNAKYLGTADNPYYALIEVTTQNLTSYQIHQDAKIIADYVFSSCSRLTNITIPDSVTSIGSYAFLGCSLLTSVTFKNTEGWTVQDSTNTPKTLSSSSLSNTSTAAQYLRTYDAYTWTREE